MPDNTNSPSSNWTSTQAYVLAVICLVVGGALGWFLRGSETPKSPTPDAASTSAPAGMMGGQMPTQDQMKHMVEKQAEPLFAKLKENPNDAATLASIGNMFYDAQLYPEAISYYEKSLKIDPNSAAVRTDKGTARFYMGDTDAAVAEIQAVLKDNPSYSPARFNLGMFQWKGKGDIKAAVDAWEYLLKNDPNYPDRDKVQQLVDQAKKHMNMAPGTKTSKSTKM